MLLECLFTLQQHKALDWIGLGWIGVEWIGLDWMGLDWIGLDWIGLGWKKKRLEAATTG